MTTTSDGRTRDEHGRLLENCGIAAPRWPTHWEYVSKAPYRIQRHDEHDNPMEIDCWNADELAYAIGIFVEAGLPEMPDVTMVLMDERFRVILGYVSAFGGIEGLGAAQWFGTGETFDFLARWTDINAVDLAIWESLARGRT
jgi:hypothetical protein